MLYRDLRDWTDKVREFGELRTLDGIDWNLEIGAITELATGLENSQVILFDNIKDYPPGFRILVGIRNPTLKRQCLTNHLPLEYDRGQFIQAWRERLNHPRLIPPTTVDGGPALENVMEERYRSCFFTGSPLARSRRRSILGHSRRDDHSRPGRRLGECRVLPGNGP